MDRRDCVPRLRLTVCRSLGLLASLVLALLAAISPGPAAAEGGLEVLQVGWDGTVVPGSWSPVRVRIAGGAADATARVEVVLKVRYQPGPQMAAVEYPTGAYGQEVTLPAGVSKEVTVWVPPDGGSSMVGDVRLMAGEQLLAEERVEFRSSETPYWPLVGALSESSSVARLLGEIEMSTQGLPVPLTIARVSPGDVPPVSERLGALRVIVVQGNAASTLTGEQKRSVREWVDGGGHLLILGGPDAARAAEVLPAGTIPVSFGELRTSADLSPLGRWPDVGDVGLAQGPVARMQVEGGSVLAGSPESPHAWRIGLGQGTVTVLAADPSLEPLSSWAGTPGLLKKAIEPALPGPDENEKILYMRMMEQNSAMQLQDAVNALPREAYPDWKLVALLLGGFALLVGPVLHLLLQRLDRRGWIWVGVPVMALLLTAGLYYTGIGRDGRDVLLHVVSHVQMNQGSGEARQALFAGFFAPTHEEFDVTVPGDAPVRVGSVYGPSYYGGPFGSMPGQSEPPFYVTSGRDTEVRFASGQWGMRYLAYNRALGDQAGGVTARLGIEEGLIKGTVRNDTPYHLEDAAVVVAQSLVKLGSLAPGQTAQVVLDPGPPPNPFEGYQGLQALLFGEPPEGSMGAAGGIGYGTTISAVSSRSVAVARPVPAAVPPPAPSGPTPTPATPPATPPEDDDAAPDPTPTASLTPDGEPTPTPTPAPAAPMPAPMPYKMQQQPLMIPNDPEIQRKVRLLNPIVNVPMWGPGQFNMPLTFLAFTRDAVGEELPSAASHPTYYLSLLQQPLRLEFPAGPFTIPAGLSPGEMAAQTSRGMGGGSNGTFSWLELTSGSVTYAFHPPLPSSAQVEALVITTQQLGPAFGMGMDGRVAPPTGPDGRPSAAEAGLFALYNWEAASWDPLPGGAEQTRISPASPYLGTDGTVKLQVSAPVDQTVRFILPDLTVEGRVIE